MGLRLVAVRDEGQVVALGMGVLEDGWLGIFNMATLPAFRRQGLAGAVLAGLADWAAYWAGPSAGRSG